MITNFDQPDGFSLVKNPIVQRAILVDSSCHNVIRAHQLSLQCDVTSTLNSVEC